MECPRDKTNLEIKIDRGIEIDECPSCKGKWLDQQELDVLEDTVFVTGLKKGTRMYAIRESDINCVKCGEQMATFNYRALLLVTFDEGIFRRNRRMRRTRDSSVAKRR